MVERGRLFPLLFRLNSSPGYNLNGVSAGESGNRFEKRSFKYKDCAISPIFHFCIRVGLFRQQHNIIRKISLFTL